MEFSTRQLQGYHQSRAIVMELPKSFGLFKNCYSPLKTHQDITKHSLWCFNSHLTLMTSTAAMMGTATAAVVAEFNTPFDCSVSTTPRMYIFYIVLSIVNNFVFSAWVCAVGFNKNIGKLGFFFCIFIHNTG